MSDAEEWWSTPQFENDNRNRETAVRAWKPGDGLRCSMASIQKVSACDAPVAVIRDVNRWNSPASQKAMTRVACLRHLAVRFTGAKASQEDPASEREALEQLAALHWDEYRTIIAAQAQKLREARLAALPDDLRKLVENIIDAGGEEE